MGINKVILVGNLGRDPEIRYTTDNTVVATMSIATGERRKDGTGNWVDHTEWHRAVCFGKLAEVVRDHLSKGRQVYVEGHLRTTKWQDKEGKDNYTTEVVVGTLQFLGSKADNNSGSTEYGEAVKDISVGISSPSFDDDDIPF